MRLSSSDCGDSPTSSTNTGSSSCTTQQQQQQQLLMTAQSSLLTMGQQSAATVASSLDGQHGGGGGGTAAAGDLTKIKGEDGLLVIKEDNSEDSNGASTRVSREFYQIKKNSFFLRMHFNLPPDQGRSLHACQRGFFLFSGRRCSHGR